MTQADEQFFRDHRDRRYRIRSSEVGESEGEFRSLGPHREDRRRVIAVRARGRLAARYGVRVMCIPFLLFADETVEDRDDVLAPIVEEIMRDAAKGYGLGGH